MTKRNLLTPQLKQQIPPLYSQDGTDAIAYVKIFATGSNWTWYITEWDGEDLCFGLVQGFEEELGYFSLTDLETMPLPVGVLIERDYHFVPTPVSSLRQKQS